MGIRYGFGIQGSATCDLPVIYPWGSERVAVLVGGGGKWELGENLDFVNNNFFFQNTGFR